MKHQNGQATKKQPQNSLTEGAVTLNLDPEVHRAYTRVIDAALKYGGCQILNDVTLLNHFLSNASKTEKDEKAT